MQRTGRHAESWTAVETGWRVEGKDEHQQSWSHEAHGSGGLYGLSGEIICAVVTLSADTGARADHYAACHTVE